MISNRESGAAYPDTEKLIQISKIFNVVDIDVDYNDLEFYKDMIDNLVNKRIVSYDKMYDVKIYISEDNLTKLSENINKYRNIVSD